MDSWVNVNTSIGEIMKRFIKTFFIVLFCMCFIKHSCCYADNSNVYNKYKNASQATKHQAISNLKRQQAEARSKANKLRVLEKMENGKLYNNQRRLETTQSSLIKTQNEYNRKLNQLNEMKARKSIAEVEYIQIYDGIKRRIRQIYKTQRKGF